MIITLLKKKPKPAPAKFKVVPPRVFVPTLLENKNPVPEVLTAKLCSLGERVRFNLVGMLAVRFLFVAGVLVTGQMFFDWLVNLSFFARLINLAIDFSLLAAFMRFRFLPAWRNRLSVDACALKVEKQWPKLKGCVIAAVQLSQPRFTVDSPELVAAVQKEAVARTETLPFEQIVDTRPMMLYGTGAVFSTFLLFIFFLIQPGSVALLGRFFLLPLPVPRATQIICLSGNMLLPVGGTALLEAQAGGVIPTEGRVTLTDDVGSREVNLERETERPDRFRLKMEAIQQSFYYTFQLNDGVSDTFRVRTAESPAVVSIGFQQIYPAYTGLAPIRRTPGDLALLAGSRLEIHALTNQKVTEAKIVLQGVDGEQPLTIDPVKGSELTGELVIPAASLRGFVIQLTNAMGITSTSETPYRIDVIPDRPPVVEMTSPTRTKELCTLKVKPHIAFSASDDFGLAKVNLCYRILKDTPEPTQKIEVDVERNSPLSVKKDYVWDLAAVQPPLTEGTTLEFWLEAADINIVTGPGYGESEHHVIRIVSEMEKRAEVINRLLDTLKNVSDISHDEDKINHELKDVIQGKSDSK